MLPPHRQMFYQLCDLDVERYDVVHKLHFGVSVEDLATVLMNV